MTVFTLSPFSPFYAIVYPLLLYSAAKIFRLSLVYEWCHPGRPTPPPSDATACKLQATVFVFIILIMSKIEQCDNFETVRGSMSWCQWVLITNRKSHTGFRLVRTSVTLNDLERRNSPFCVISQNSIALQFNYVTVVEDRPIISAKLVFQLYFTLFSSFPFLSKL